MNQKRVLLPVLAVLVAIVAAASALGAASGLPRKRAVPETPIKIASKRHINPAVTRKLRDATWRWQVLIGLHRSS